MCEFFDLIDLKLSDIVDQIDVSVDPDSDGLFDRGEYFIGIGFVVMQQYLIETIMHTGLEKSEAYKLGPVHSSGDSVVSIINSCANWWKHEAEWENLGEVPNNGKKTFLQVLNASESEWYNLSNVLASLCGKNDLRFHSLLPHIEQWRTCVHNNRKK